ncbi:MAG: IMPACT family protein [Reichenbachiella sp.]
MAETYRILTNEPEGLYKEKGSKFIAYAYHVERLEEVKIKVDALRKKYYDARHWCYAHIINDGNQQLVRANDDGEPNHSAGDPILGQIRSFDLVNTLVVVVRYFGGTKLGVSGLVHAYRAAAEDALRQAEIRVVEIKTDFELEYGYEQTNEVLRLLNDFGVEIKNQEFQASCLLRGRIEPELFKGLQEKLALLKLKAEVD